MSPRPRNSRMLQTPAHCIGFCFLLVLRLVTVCAELGSCLMVSGHFLPSHRLIAAFMLGSGFPLLKERKKESKNERERKNCQHKRTNEGKQKKAKRNTQKFSFSAFSLVSFPLCFVWSLCANLQILVVLL